MILFILFYIILGTLFTSFIKKSIESWIEKTQISSQENMYMMGGFRTENVNKWYILAVWPIVIFFILGFHFGERVFKRNYRDINNPEALSWLDIKNPMLLSEKES